MLDEVSRVKRSKQPTEYFSRDKEPRSSVKDASNMPSSALKSARSLKHSAALSVSFENEVLNVSAGCSHLLSVCLTFSMNTGYF